jgi:hypothetical protein
MAVVVEVMVSGWEAVPETRHLQQLCRRREASCQGRESNVRQGWEGFVKSGDIM